MSSISDTLSAAGTGATAGATIGSVVPGVGTGIGAILGALLAGGASYLTPDQKPTQTQGRQSELIDQLLASLKGDGPYSDLLNADDATFQKNFVEPAKGMFERQIAPQIQQSYIASGQQRGTGLDDTLARAGVDMDQMLAGQYGQYQQNAQQNQMNTIARILGMAPGAETPMTGGEKISSGISGYLSSPAAGEGIESILSMLQSKPNPNNQQQRSRAGFTNE